MRNNAMEEIEEEDEIVQFDGPRLLEIEADYIITHFPEIPKKISKSYWTNLKFTNKR
jgi:hypothetical protein